MAKKEKNYYVTCTLIYNGGISVSATSASKAIAKAREIIDGMTFQSDIDGFSFGECTADYADEEEILDSISHFLTDNPQSPTEY